MAVLAVLALDPAAAAGAGPALDPLDLALLRGEAVFEAMRVYGGRPFRLQAHLDRLAASAAAIDLVLPDGLEGLAGRAVEAAGGGDAVLRLICTKGPEASGRRGSEEGGPVAFAICTDIPEAFEAERRRGLRLVLLTTAADPLLRAASPWLLPGAKTISYALNMAAQRAARAHGADDAVLVGLGGELLEAPTANLGLKVLDGVFGAEDLTSADEAFLSSSTRELMPVVEVDGAPIADGRPGPTAAALQAALRRLATTSA